MTADAPVPSTSSDAVLRCFAPPVISLPYRAAVSPFGDNRSRLGRRIAMIDVLLRYLVAVLSAEAAALGLEAPSQWTELCDRLATPSLGSWSQAALALSRAILSRQERAVAPGIAGILARPRRGGPPRPTDAGMAIQRLVAMRNRHVHGASGNMVGNEESAGAALAEARDDLHTVFHSLRALRGYVLAVTWEVRKLPGQANRWQITLARLVGFEVDRVPITVDGGFLCERGVPILVSPAGHALRLDPFLRAEVGPDRDSPDLLLLARARGAKGIYSDPATGSEREVQLERPIAELVRARPVSSVRADGLLDATAAARLLEGSWTERRPEVPGFLVLHAVGRGASGTVYLAQRESDHRHVALKVLDPDLVPSSAQRHRLAREHRVMRTLDHPNVVKALGLHRTPNQGPVLEMEWIEGQDLAAETSTKRLAQHEAVQVVSQVLSALEAAHTAGIVHRDVKPSNVLLDRSGQAHLTDFGIAQLAGADRLTRTLDAVGTTSYAAPEQLANRPTGPAADIYATGVLLRELLSGRFEPHGKIPPGLHAVIRRATAHRPQDRYPDAKAMLQALRNTGDCPVGPGDRLAEGHLVQGVVAELEPGIWELRGVERERSTPRRFVVACTSPAARQRLREAVAGAPAEVALMPTTDGLLYAVLPDGDGIGQALLAGKLPRPSAADSTSTIKSALFAAGGLAVGIAVAGLAGKRRKKQPPS